MTIDQRKAIISFLLDESFLDDGVRVLARGAKTRAASHFELSNEAIRKIWKRAVETRNDPNRQSYFSSPRKKGIVGRNLKYDS